MNNISADPPERVTAMLLHLHVTYSDKLSIPENIHVLSGLVTPEVTIPFAMGVSVPQCPVERATYWAYMDGGPLVAVGGEGANGLWAMYISQPAAAYDEQMPLGRTVELVLYGEEGEASRYVCSFPADYPNTNAELSVEPRSFPWETV